MRWLSSNLLSVLDLCANVTVFIRFLLMIDRAKKSQLEKVKFVILPKIEHIRNK